MMRYSIFAAAPLVALVATLSWSDRIEPLSLIEIVQASGKVFEGECIAERTGRDPDTGLLATWYDFKVIDGIHGDLGETVTVKQYGGSDGEISVYSPVAKYEPGERVILFLYGESEVGFSSAIGFSQGKFSVQEHPETGIRTVTNGMPALTLFKEMDVALAPYGASGKMAVGPERLNASRLEHREFLDLVRELVEREKERARVEER
jgi:hypothetical protein